MNKYGAIPCQGFPSKLEKAVGDMLRYREMAGEISNIRRQHRIKLGLIWWKCDFSYTEKGETVFLEAKGFQDKKWRMIRKLWKDIGPAKLVVMGGRWQRPQTIEVIERGTYASKII